MPPLLPPRSADPIVADRCWTLHSPGGVRDVIVRVADDAVLGDVLALLGGTADDGALWAGSRRLAPTTPLTAPDLRHGAELGLGRPGPRVSPAGGALELRVTGGPDSGQVLALGQGTLTLGRGRTCDVSLADPDISRQHLAVTVAGTGVSVVDLGSANGSELDAAAAGTSSLAGTPVPWELGADLRLGGSRLRLAAPEGRPVDLAPAPGGRLRVRAGGRPLGAPLRSVAISVPEEPTERPRRALAWIAIAVPAVAGVLMAWLLSAPHFLFFALLSPLVALGTWVSDRFSGRRGHRRSVTEYAATLAQAEHQVGLALAAERSARELAAPDAATLITAARRQCEPLWTRGRGDPDLLVVRLSSGPGPSQVSRVTGSTTAEVVLAALSPVTVDLRGGGLGIHGPREVVLRVARSLVCQIAALHPPSAVGLSLLTSVGTVGDWRWARWLPQLGQPPMPRGTTAPGPQQLVIVDVPMDDTGIQQVRELRAAGSLCLVLTPGPTVLDVEGAPSLSVAGETGSQGRLARTGLSDQELLIDGVGEPVAARWARHLAPLTSPTQSGGIPESVRWVDLGPPPDWSRTRSSLTATLGVGAHGPVSVDLCAVGPHALVAGTTGSGKSELLRSLVLGLAAGHPPDRCSLLLIDYKGGSAFAEAADLPHTVGLLTDLDGASTARALRSLTAELTRRETLLADHGVRELAGLPDDVDLARLVIVVDEFATLTDELPDFVPGLVGIAARGRSLGVHLVLATQRPAGVVSPEIRANCTVRICLRTTDEAGSRDVLGVPDAAWLPVSLPGRALLRVGPGGPVALQVARVAAPADRARRVAAVAHWSWPTAPTVPGDDMPAPEQQSGTTIQRTAESPSELAREVVALSRRASSAGLRLPPRPWLPPLPDRIPPADRFADLVDDTRPELLCWGLWDRPERQAQEPLLMDLTAGGGWLLPGGPRSGRTTALRTVLGEATRQLPPERLHVHVIDHGGGELATHARGLAHTGTVVGREDGFRLLRLVTRLQDVVDARRAGSVTDQPLLVLLVDGVDSVLLALEELSPGGGTGQLLRLVREGAAVGLTCLLTADRVLPGGRLASATTHRLVLPFADRADYVVAGVPARAVPGHRPPGRALGGDDAAQAQIAQPRAPEHPQDDGAAGRSDVLGRISVVELSADPPPCPATSLGGRSVALGPGGDDGTTVSIDLARSGGLLVCGPPGSGRTTTLAAMAARLHVRGVPVLAVRSRGDDRTWAAAGAPPSGRAEHLAEWATALEGRVGVLLVDDLNQLADSTAEQVTALCAPGGPALLVASSTAVDVAAAFRGPAVALRRARSALLLRPARGDADLLSLRLPRTGLPPRPGSGWLLTDGTTTRVQVARERPPDAAKGWGAGTVTGGATAELATTRSSWNSPATDSSGGTVGRHRAA